jgi:hypothetical protein
MFTNILGTVLVVRQMSLKERLERKKYIGVEVGVKTDCQNNEHVSQDGNYVHDQEEAEEEGL